MPIRVMPICTVDRNLPGSAASFSATLAPLLPPSAADPQLRRARRHDRQFGHGEHPVEQDQPARCERSIQGNGVMVQPALADLRAREDPLCGTRREAAGNSSERRAL
jgi:hypothetical protein